MTHKTDLAHRWTAVAPAYSKCLTCSLSKTNGSHQLRISTPCLQDGRLDTFNLLRTSRPCLQQLAQLQHAQTRPTCSNCWPQP